MTKQSTLAHYQDMAQNAVNPALRTSYKGEQAFAVTVDGVAFEVRGFVEAASGGYLTRDYEPATVSINSICWAGSDLDMSNLLSDSAISVIQDRLDEQAEGMAH